MPQWRQVAPESRCLPLAFRHTLTPRHWVSMPWSSWWRESNLLPLATVVYSSKPLARCGIWKGWVSLLTKGWQRLDLNKGALRWPVHSAQNLFSFSTPLREISHPTTRIQGSQGWNAKIGIHFGKPSLPVFHSEACDSQQHASLGGTGLDSWVFLFAHNTMCFRHLGSADCWPARYSAVRGPRQHSWGRLLSRRRSQICPQVVFNRRHIAKAIVKSFPDFLPCQICFLKYL